MEGKDDSGEAGSYYLPEAFQVSEKSARRYLEDAIGQIAALIIRDSGNTKVAQEIDSDEGWLADADSSEALQTLQPGPLSTRFAPTPIDESAAVHSSEPAETILDREATPEPPALDSASQPDFESSSGLDTNEMQVLEPGDPALRLDRDLPVPLGQPLPDSPKARVATSGARVPTIPTKVLLRATRGLDLRFIFIIFVTGSGLFLTWSVAPSLPWDSILREPTRFLLENRYFYFVCSGTIVTSLAILWAGLVCKRSSDREKWKAVGDIACKWSFVTIPIAIVLAAALVVAHVQAKFETSEYSALQNEAKLWAEKQYLRFEEQSPANQQNACQSPNRYIEPHSPKLVLGRLKKDALECQQSAGFLTLSTTSMNALPGNEGSLDLGDIFAEVLMSPQYGTDWSRCGLAAYVPDVLNARFGEPPIERVLMFSFEYVDDGWKSGYKPVVIAIGELGQYETVARSSIVVPHVNGEVVGEPRDDWLKVSVLRTKNNYTYFVNERKVLDYHWAHGTGLSNLMLQAYARQPLSQKGGILTSCRFDDFSYRIQSEKSIQ